MSVTGWNAKKKKCSTDTHIVQTLTRLYVTLKKNCIQGIFGTVDWTRKHCVKVNKQTHKYYTGFLSHLHTSMWECWGDHGSRRGTMGGKGVTSLRGGSERGWYKACNMKAEEAVLGERRGWQGRGAKRDTQEEESMHKTVMAIARTL